MQKQYLFIGIYAFLVLIGGLMGFLIANSYISLIVSSIFSAILLSCCYFGWKEYNIAYRIASLTVLFLFAFFSYRFATTFKFMPAGLMILISGALLIYLFASRKQMTNCKAN